MRSGELNPGGANETRIMLWILGQLRDRYPDDLWERQNVLVAHTKNRTVKAGTSGQGDLRGCHCGHYCELEVKKPGEAQLPSQVKRQDAVTRAGGTYAVVHNPTEAFAVVDAIR